MSVKRRIAWGVVLLAWPAAMVVRVMWGPWWDGDLSDWAPWASCVLGLALLRDGGVPRVRDWRRGLRHKREMAALRAQVNQQQQQIAALSDGLARAFGAAGKAAPAAAEDRAGTRPALRVVG